MSERANSSAPPAGFYETFRTSGGRPHHWRYNLRRLRPACAAAGLTLPTDFLAHDEARLGAAVSKLLQAGEYSEAVFRYEIEAGSPVPSEKLALRPLPAAPPEAGVALRVLGQSRTPADRLPRAKRSGDAEVRLGTEELARRSVAASDEGLFLSRDGGFVVETTRQAVCWIAGAVLHYPDPAVGGVAGSCFAWVLEQGLPTAPRRASLDEMLAADALVVCNAVRGTTPVREVWDRADRARLATFDSARHPIVQRLSAAWADALRVTAEAAR